ncbi:hypothetical protein ACLOJK_005679 [Asimina triloba]
MSIVVLRFVSRAWQPLPPLPSPFSLSPLLRGASFSLSLSRLCFCFLPLFSNRLQLASPVPPLIHSTSLSISHLCFGYLLLSCFCSGNRLRLASLVVRTCYTNSSSLSLSCNTSSSRSPSLSPFLLHSPVIDLPPASVIINLSPFPLSPSPFLPHLPKAGLHLLLSPSPDSIFPRLRILPSPPLSLPPPSSFELHFLPSQLDTDIITSPFVTGH